jgi:hypothetical protein
MKESSVKQKRDGAGRIRLQGSAKDKHGFCLSCVVGV